MVKSVVVLIAALTACAVVVAAANPAAFRARLEKKSSFSPASRLTVPPVSLPASWASFKLTLGVSLGVLPTGLSVPTTPNNNNNNKLKAMSEPLTAASTKAAEIAAAAAAGAPASSSSNGAGMTLMNVNQCATNNGGCDPLQTCNDSPDESDSPYQCSPCPDGYFSPTTGPNDEGTCYDIDECSWQNGGCAGTCTNTPGSWYCS